MSSTDVGSRHPTPTGRERAELLLRRSLGVFPGLGPVAALLDSVLAPAFTKRTIEWLNLLATRIERAEHHLDGLSLDDLAAEPEWCDLVLQATRAAGTTSREEKRRMLSNAVINAMLETAPSVDVASGFIHLVDVLSPSHIQLLALYQDARAFAASRGQRAGLTRSRRELARALIPEMGGNLEMFRLDLVSHGLIVSGTEAVMKEREGPSARFTTSLGDEFLRFRHKRPG